MTKEKRVRFADDLEPVDAKSSVEKSIIASLSSLLHFSNDDERNANVTKLLATLLSLQSSHDPNAVPDTDSNELSLYSRKGLSRLCSPSLVYAVKRLIRGLAGSRPEARLGYSTTLAAVLDTFKNELPVKDVFELIEKMLTAQAIGDGFSLKKSEVSSLMSGRFAALAALVESRKEEISGALEEKLIKDLFSLLRSKSFVRQPALELLLGLHTKKNENFIASLISKEPFSPECLSLCIELMVNYRPADHADQVNQVDGFAFENSPTLQSLPNPTALQSKANLPKYKQILLESCCYVEPRMHPLIKSIVLLTRHSSTSCDNFTLYEFWETVVNEGLLAGNSVEKKRLGIAILMLCINDPTFKTTEILQLFTSGCLELLNFLIAKQSAAMLPLNQDAIATMAAIASKCHNDQQFALLFLEKLELVGGHVSKLSDLVLKQLGGQSISRYIDLLKKLNVPSQQLCDRLLYVHRNCPLDPLEKLQVSKYVASELLGLSLLSDSNHVRELASQRLQSVVTDSFSFCRKESGGTDTMLKFVFDWISENSELVGSRDEPTKDLVQLVMSTHSYLAKALKGKHHGHFLCTLMSLLHLLTFFWLIDPDVASSALNDLKRCLKKISKQTKGTSLDLAEHVELTIDILLSVAAKPYLFARQFSKLLFQQLVPYLTMKSIELLIDAFLAPFDELLTDEEIADEEITDEEITGKENIQGNQLSESSDSETIDLDDADEGELHVFEAKLAEIFSLKKKEKQEKKRNQEALNSLKHRIIEWIRIVLVHRADKQPVSTKVIIHLVKEFPKCIEYAIRIKNGDLLKQTRSVLMEAVRKRSRRKINAEEQTAVQDAIKQLVEFAKTHRRSAVLLDASSASIWLLHRLDTGDSSWLQEEFSNLWRYFLAEHTKHLECGVVAFFNDWVDRRPGILTFILDEPLTQRALETSRPFFRLRLQQLIRALTLKRPKSSIAA